MHDGGLHISYVSGSELGDKERPLAVQPRIIDPDRITASDEESVHVRDVD